MLLKSKFHQGQLYGVAKSRPFISSPWVLTTEFLLMRVNEEIAIIFWISLNCVMDFTYTVCGF